MTRDGRRCGSPRSAATAGSVSDAAGDFRLEVAHIISARARPDLAYELSNLRTLDRKCHVEETRAERSGGNDPRRQAWRELLKTPLPTERNDDA